MPNEARIQALEDQLGRMQDIRDIEQLKYHYASCCDRGYDPATNDAVVLTLNYVDQFVKRGDRWLFKELRGTMHQASNWELGWVKQQWRP